MKRLLICNACGDLPGAPISRYLLETRREAVVRGVEIAAKETGADILFLLPDGMPARDLPGEVRYGGRCRAGLSCGT